MSIADQHRAKIEALESLGSLLDCCGSDGHRDAMAVLTSYVDGLEAREDALFKASVDLLYQLPMCWEPNDGDDQPCMSPAFWHIVNGADRSEARCDRHAAAIVEGCGFRQKQPLAHAGALRRLIAAVEAAQAGGRPSEEERELR